jgi:hypothetical protein
MGSLKLFAIGFIAFTGYLLLYHTMLIMNGMTTWEHMRKPRINYLRHMPPGYNPFSLGVVQNLKAFFSEPTRYTGQQTVQSWSSHIPTY